MVSPASSCGTCMQAIYLISIFNKKELWLGAGYRYKQLVAYLWEKLIPVKVQTHKVHQISDGWINCCPAAVGQGQLHQRRQATE